MAGELTPTKIHTIAKENEEKKASDRKRNLLYLIASYLEENGFKTSAECFSNEANLPTNFEVCDNIDLDIILQEYTTYYYTKFKKNPKFIRKTDLNTVSPKLTTPKPKKATPLKKTESPKESSPISTVSPFTITTPLQKPDCQAFRPLYDFSGFNSEWKELADMISKDIISKDLNVFWDDIKGLDDAKSLLKEAVLYPVQYPELFGKLAVPWKGILLYGPPGTGKTFLAKALASQCKSSTFFNMSASSLVSKWRGESEKLVRVLFELAKYQSPATVFIDEIDALGSKRDDHQHEASRRFKSQLLIEMDGINNTPNENVFLLATSNLPWEIDPAILRRFEKRILIDFPSSNARLEIFRHYLNEFTNVKHLRSHDYANFSSLTEGYTGSDIKLVCKEAAIIPIRKAINNRGNAAGLVSLEDIVGAIGRTKPSARNVKEKYQKWHEKYGCV